MSKHNVAQVMDRTDGTSKSMYTYGYEQHQQIREIWPNATDGYMHIDAHPSQSDYPFQAICMSV